MHHDALATELGMLDQHDPLLQIQVGDVELEGFPDPDPGDSIPRADGRRIAVIGAGFVGTELASHYVAAGADVVLVGRSAMPLVGAIGAEISPRLVALQRGRTDARLGTTVRSRCSPTRSAISPTP